MLVVRDDADEKRKQKRTKHMTISVRTFSLVGLTVTVIPKLFESV